MPTSFRDRCNSNDRISARITFRAKRPNALSAVKHPAGKRLPSTHPNTPVHAPITTQIAAAASRCLSAAAAPENPPVVHKAAIPCTGLAREKLMTGLTHYYLQRNLRPRAPSEGVADTASITNLLAGPGDPVATTPEISCTG